MQRNVKGILPNVLSPFEEYCSASGMQPLDCYVTTPFIATAVTPLECSHSGSQMLDNIIAFDRAEVSFANISQVNMVQVSSFNGLNGILLGYDLLRQPDRSHPLLKDRQLLDVFDLQPIMETTKSLYGTIDQKHFPIAPGQHLLCAYKTYYQNGPCTIYGALAIGIPEDRSKNADLFMEDHGVMMSTHDEAANGEQELTILENLINSVTRVGQNLHITYAKIYIGFKYQNVGAGQIGCVITCVPYIKLAQHSIPHNNVYSLMDISLQEWEEVCKEFYMDS